MFHQDWEPVVLKKKKPTNVKKAKKLGYKVHTTMKKGGYNNSSLFKKNSISKKFDDNEPQKIKTVSFDVKRAIQKGRLAKQMSQKELAQRLNLRGGVIRDYELGKAIPSGKILNRIGRLLNVRLTGKKIGQPFNKEK